MEFKDKSDNVINSGDYVAYAVAPYRSAEMRIGKVVEVVKADKTGRPLTTLRLRVMCVERHWKDGLKLKSKTSSVKDKARIIRLEPHQVHSDVLNLLDPVAIR